MASLRRTFEARGGLVLCRGAGGSAACRISATSRSRASSRLRSWLRKRAAVMTITPSPVMRRAGQPLEPHAHGLGQRRRAARIEPQLHRGRHLVDVLPARPRGAHERLLQLGVSIRIVSVTCSMAASRRRAGVSCYQTALTHEHGIGTAAMTNDARKAIDDLLAVMAALRTPGSGCPWDLAQTFKTIAPYTIEEAYEVADAIEKGDMGALKDELGDLLLQVVYHARMAEEEGAFAFADVADAITAKMIRRHPHVFGSRGGARGRRGAGLLGAHQGRGRRQPRQRPRLAGVRRAEVRRAGRCAGRPPGAHARRQVAGQSRQGRLRLAVAGARVRQAQGGAGRAGAGVRCDASERASRQPKIEEEFGDLLFVVANVARHLKIDPEAALRAATRNSSAASAASRSCWPRKAAPPRSRPGRDGPPVGPGQGRGAQNGVRPLASSEQRRCEHQRRGRHAEGSDPVSPRASPPSPRA